MTVISHIPVQEIVLQQELHKLSTYLERGMAVEADLDEKSKNDNTPGEGRVTVDLVAGVSAPAMQKGK